MSLSLLLTPTFKESWRSSTNERSLHHHTNTNRYVYHRILFRLLAGEKILRAEQYPAPAGGVGRKHGSNRIRNAGQPRLPKCSNHRLPGWVHSGRTKLGRAQRQILKFMNRATDIVICGAGIAGVAAAHFLSKTGVKNIVLLDERPPLSFTSDHSTECYRNWWPDPAMLALMNRSIDLMEALADESGNIFRMNRRGYLYLTADEKKAVELETAAHQTSILGAGPVRVHSSSSLYYQPASNEGFHDQPTGADFLVGNDLIHKYFPYLTNTSVAALHVRRAGWLSAQQLGMYLLETARRNGVRFESARVTGVDMANGHVNGVHLSSGERIDSPTFINAAGPYLKHIGSLLGIDLPVYTELHLKAAIKDPLRVVGRD